MPTNQPPTPEAANEAAKNDAPSRKPELAPAAERALAEAAARRAERDGQPLDQAKEVNGRGGLEPTRFGDWEINGLASDF